MVQSFKLTGINEHVCPIKGVTDTTQTETKDQYFKFHNSVDEIGADWDELLPASKSLLSTAYWKALEAAPTEGMKFCYLAFYCEGKIFGVAVCQIIHFNASESMNSLEDDKPQSVYSAVSLGFKKAVARHVDYTVLVCGNVLFTGEHGYYFKGDFDQQFLYNKLSESLDVARNHLSKQGQKISFTFLKDFYKETQPDIGSALKTKGFHEFNIQPSMILDIREHWNTFEDYLAQMSSKYRVRAKSVMKKAKAIQIREFDLPEINQYKSRISELYINIAKKSGFNAVILNEDYFSSLKEHLGDQFRLYGHFLEDQLVAFHTTIAVGDELEAHFLGFDHQLNREHKIYNNTLYVMIQFGIANGFKKVVFARTALEIKSSVGAVAHEMFCYFRYKSAIPNKFLKSVFDYLNDKESWTPRSPFKES